AEALAHLVRHAVAEEADELVEEDLEPLLREAEGGEGAADAGGVAVVIGAEHGDQPVVAAPDLVGVVGALAPAVGEGAVLLADGAVLGVALLGALEEEGALALLEVALLRELGEGGADAAPTVEALLAEPDVVLDAELGERALDAGQQIRAGHAVEHP